MEIARWEWGLESRERLPRWKMLGGRERLLEWRRLEWRARLLGWRRLVQGDAVRLVEAVDSKVKMVGLR